MKIELKHIAAYLPYGLRWYHSNRKGTHPITFYNANTIITAVNNQNYKIVLRPMSDLYKEINGEVGINIIGNIIEPKGNEIGWVEEVGWFGIFYDTYDYENQNENFTGDYLPYNREIAEYLDVNYFDWRYNLIDKNIAINLNEIDSI